jgi:hypothetical protein
MTATKVFSLKELVAIAADREVKATLKMSKAAIIRNIAAVAPHLAEYLDDASNGDAYVRQCIDDCLCRGYRGDELVANAAMFVADEGIATPDDAPALVARVLDAMRAPDADALITVTPDDEPPAAPQQERRVPPAPYTSWRQYVASPDAQRNYYVNAVLAGASDANAMLITVEYFADMSEGDDALRATVEAVQHSCAQKRTENGAPAPVTLSQQATLAERDALVRFVRARADERQAAAAVAPTDDEPLPSFDDDVAVEVPAPAPAPDTRTPAYAAYKQTSDAVRNFYRDALDAGASDENAMLATVEHFCDVDDSDAALRACVERVQRLAAEYRPAMLTDAATDAERSVLVRVVRQRASGEPTAPAVVTLDGMSTAEALDALFENDETVVSLNGVFFMKYEKGVGWTTNLPKGTPVTRKTSNAFKTFVHRNGESRRWQRASVAAAQAQAAVAANWQQASDDAQAAGIVLTHDDVLALALDTGDMETSLHVTANTVHGKDVSIDDAGGFDAQAKAVEFVDELTASRTFDFASASDAAIISRVSDMLVTRHALLKAEARKMARAGYAAWQQRQADENADDARDDAPAPAPAPAAPAATTKPKPSKPAPAPTATPDGFLFDVADMAALDAQIGERVEKKAERQAQRDARANIVPMLRRADSLRGGFLRVLAAQKDWMRQEPLLAQVLGREGRRWMKTMHLLVKEGLVIKESRPEDGVRGKAFVYRITDKGKAKASSIALD